ncbi:MAG: hypothetical protein RR595_04535 [Lysinibacillus sp.]
MGNKGKRNIKFVMWFIFLSTLGVGGGIFFLLFAVVPIEQIYVDRGWSQFNIDNIMKYYVIGWVVFGFVMSFLYYFFILKKNFWKIGTLLMVASIALCSSALYYFLNTGSSVVQSSQGELETHGERFTFGPYPEADDLERLAKEGYDGVITLLSPTLPIEKPLLNRQIKNGEKAGIEIYSMPMLPWVGDNTETLESIKKLITQDDKRYYVHCYLGRHRVDVVKQLISQELQLDFEILVLQPTKFERGHVIYYDDKKVAMGPYPTNEEWFTRIRRSEVKEVVSLLPAQSKLLEKEKQVAAELGIKFTHMPIEKNSTTQDIQQAVDYVNSLDHRAYVHDFNNSEVIKIFEALFSWQHAIETNTKWIKESSNITHTLGAKMLIGKVPTEQFKNALQQEGVRQFVEIPAVTIPELYQIAENSVKQQETTYFYTNDTQRAEQFFKMINGLLYGSRPSMAEFNDVELTNGMLKQYKRKLVVGPTLTDSEFESFALANGVARIILLHPASLIDENTKNHMQKMADQYQIPLTLIPMEEGFEEPFVSAINKELGLTYVLTDAALLDTVNQYVKKY